MAIVETEKYFYKKNEMKLRSEVKSTYEYDVVRPVYFVAFKLNQFFFI